MGANNQPLKRYKYICKQCGIEYTAKCKNRDTYCSRKCYFDNKRDNAKPKIKKEKATYKHNCITCGTEFITKNKGKKYCSKHCYPKPTRKIYEGMCKQCGSRFQSNNKRIYCSKECSIKSNDWWSKNKKRRRRLIMSNGEIDKDLTLERLFIRDKGICHICGQPCFIDNHYNDNYYPSIDHVLPLSKGGTHTWNNVRLAHRICNSYKGNKKVYPAI